MEKFKFYEFPIMSVKGYPHVYDKSKASSKDEIVKDNSWLSTGENLKNDHNTGLHVKNCMGFFLLIFL